MKALSFSQAIDDALGQAMARDESIVVLGEDTPMVRRGLHVRFGPKRVRSAPISESAFVGAAVAASMAGLRPVVEIWLVDFLSVCMDALVNHAAKVDAFSGGRWNAPMVVRAPCSAGYGDAGQHEQSLWGWLAHIPGLTVVVPSTPADAGGLMTGALQHGGPVIFLESKLLSEAWLDFLGGGRTTLQYDIPAAGSRGSVPRTWQAIPFGEALARRAGTHMTIVSVGVGVHRALEAAALLQKEGIEAGVLDLRTVSPLDRRRVREEVAQTGRLLVVDEDYEGFGLSGELMAIVAEAGVQCKYARVCTRQTIPYAWNLQRTVLPGRDRICSAARQLMQ
jgi:pyruvate/2-oxoglutarate/acetoin dehydrogenase E1 component